MPDAAALEAFANGPAPSGADSMDDDPDAVEGGEKRDLGGLIGALKSNADELEAALEELDPDTLLNVDEELAPEDAQILQEGYDAFGEGLHDPIEAVLPLSEAEVLEVSSAVAEDDAFESPELIGGYLMRLSDLKAAGGAPEGDDIAGDDDAGDEEVEEEETE